MACTAADLKLTVGSSYRYLVFRNKIIPYDINGEFRTAGNDMIGPSKGTTEPVVLIMPSEPSVSVDTVADETQIIHLDDLSCYLIFFVLLHDHVVFQLPHAEIRGCR